MAEVERLMVASMVRLSVLDPRHPHARACVRAYFTELASRFDGGYDPSLDISVSDEEMTQPAGLFLVAVLHDEPVGCGALKFRPDAQAEVKRMWVAPLVRGLGLGRRLLTELERRAAAQNVRTVRLDTNRNLSEAINMYRTSGYSEVPAFNQGPYIHHWFEKVI
jgi:GNAT superfamily N-acetyltransferase